MKKNKSVYLTKWEKQIITAMIETHLENVKTNPYFEFIEDEFQRMINKLEIKEETISGVITKPKSVLEDVIEQSKKYVE
jgi:hypothetical protein